VTGLLTALALALGAGLDAGRWHRDRQSRWEAEAEAERTEWAALKRTDEVVTVAQAADIVGRAPSTIHGWIAAGKLRRIDRGGRGTPALLALMDVLRAEHGVRGRGRPPVAR
jgi:hypothetical protein